MIVFGDCSAATNKSEAWLILLQDWILYLLSFSEYIVQNLFWIFPIKISPTALHTGVSAALSVWWLLQKLSSQKVFNWHTYKRHNFFKGGSSPRMLKLTSFTIKYLGSCSSYLNRHQGKSNKLFLCYIYRCGV